jgi:hypothetical protein
MKILDKLRRRRPDRAEWLAKNPGKGAFQMPANAEADAASAKRTRELMESEMLSDTRRAQERRDAAGSTD